MAQGKLNSLKEMLSSWVFFLAIVCCECDVIVFLRATTDKHNYLAANSCLGGN